jgi:ribulose-phosphate 3-epimerase
MQIYISILEHDRKAFSKQLSLVKNISNQVQIDIIENWHEKNTISLNLIKKKDLQGFKSQFHLMVDKPVNYLTKIKKIGSKAVIAQIEKMKDQLAFIKKGQSLELETGLSLDIRTPLTNINKQVYWMADYIQLMAILSGAQGRSFDKKVLGKISKLVRLKKDYKFGFETIVDGGINLQTAKWCKGRGINSLAVGTYILKSNNPNQDYQKLNTL